MASASCFSGVKPRRADFCIVLFLIDSPFEPLKVGMGNVYKVLKLEAIQSIWGVFRVLRRAYASQTWSVITRSQSLIVAYLLPY